MERASRLLADLDCLRVTTWVRPIWRATLIAWLPAQAIYLVVATVLPGPKVELYPARPYQAIALAIFIAPVLETYALRWVLRLLGRFVQRRNLLCWVSAVLWGAMHWNTPAWGLHAVWAFYVMNVFFLTLQEKDPQTALYATMLLHGLFNAISYSAFLLVGDFLPQGRG